MGKKKKISFNDFEYVVFDMDGTLLTSNKNISLKTQQTINFLKQKNKKIIIASGRPFYFIKKEINQLDITLPVISCNGALIYSPIDKKVIYQNEIYLEQATFIYNLLIDNNATFLIYTHNQMYRFKHNDESTWFKWLDKTLKNEKYDFKITDIKNRTDFDLQKNQIIKFLLIVNEISQEQYESISHGLKYLKNVYCIQSQSNVLDIMPEGSSKGSALVELDNKKIIDLSKTIVFGDALNDVSMFDVAKYSVAMGNSKKDVQKIATFKTDSNDEDGIANFFDNIKDND